MAVKKKQNTDTIMQSNKMNASVKKEKVTKKRKAPAKSEKASEKASAKSEKASEKASAKSEKASAKSEKASAKSDKASTKSEKASAKSEKASAKSEKAKTPSPPSLKRNNKVYPLPFDNDNALVNSLNTLGFNSMFETSLQSIELKKVESANEVASYEDSFQDIHSFSSHFTKKEIAEIDTIIYHDENNDGMLSAAVAYHFLKELQPEKEILVLPEKPGKDRFLQFISGKNVLILDLSLREDILRRVIQSTKSIIVIDDHSRTLMNNKNIFNGEKHSACAYTWKFFYPRKPVPAAILYIDSSDAKLFLNLIPNLFSNLFAKSIGIRYIHSKSKETMHKKMSKALFDELWELIENENKMKLLLGIGYYYYQYSESLKDQIAVNAVIANFQGYRVGILNFLSPELTKPVSRQIITHFKNKGTPVDFAVCWGYEHNGNSYRIQLTDDHKQRLINMGELAQKLGKLGGSPRGGGGHPHVGNFYWPRNGKHDIWDLLGAPTPSAGAMGT